MRIEYRLGDTVDIYESGGSAALVNGAGGAVLTISEREVPIVHGLQSGWLTADEAAELGGDLSRGYHALFSMRSAGMLNSRAQAQGAVLFTVNPAPDEAAFAQGVHKTKVWRLNRYAFIRRAEGGLLLESPLTPCRVAVHDATLAGLLCQLGSGLRLDLAGEGARVFLSVLAALGFAEAEGEAVADDPMAFWEFHDLLFHARTLHGRHTHPLGGTYRFHGKRPSLPALRAPVSREIIPLPEPSGEMSARLNRPLGTVLDQRRSRREYSAEPLTLEELGAFLHASARVTKVVEDSEHQDTLLLRVSPSGGARHPLEIYPLVRCCEGLEPGPYRYDPSGHQLERVSVGASALDGLLERNPFGVFGGGPPQVTLNLSARIGRTAWKYESIAYKLINQDLGCLYQTFYLVATALGLAPCALGSVDTASLGAAYGIDWREEPFIGAFTVGK